MPHRARLVTQLILLGMLFTAPAGCNSSQSAKTTVTLATTTSAQDTGILDYLLPKFKEASGVTVNYVAVGSGQALEIARRGDADVVLAHSPKAEEEFMAAGDGSGHFPLMHNDFLIAGPAVDPAGVKGEKSAAAAFRKIAESHSTFVSRGDESGTHARERTIWKEVEVAPEGGWYIAAGTGMAQALRIANERNAYVLTDRGTYLKLKSELELAALVEGDPKLLNSYSLILVNPEKHPHVRSAAAKKFVAYLLSPAVQADIRQFGVEKYGQALFTPDSQWDAADAK